MYKSFVSLGRYTPKYFILFVAMVNGIEETQVLNDTLDEMHLIILRTFHPNAEYTFFSSTYGTFSKIHHILGQNSNLSKFKKTEIVSSIFSDHKAMRLYINYNKKTKKHKLMEIKQHISK